MKSKPLASVINRACTFVHALRRRATEKQEELYVMFSTQSDERTMCRFTILFFNHWGEILGEQHGSMMCSEWHLLRLGERREKALVQSKLISYCERFGLPIVKSDPLLSLGDGIYKLNVDIEKWLYIRSLGRPYFAHSRLK